MFLHHGYKFDRFGEETQDFTAVDDKISSLKKEFASGVKTQFNKVKQELLDRAKAQVDFSTHYITVKDKRIVSMSDGVDANDAVNKKQLDNIGKKVNKLQKGLEITDECVKIKDSRRICNISKAKDQYDAVNLLQLTEKMVQLQEAVNLSLTSLRTQMENSLLTVTSSVTGLGKN